MSPLLAAAVATVAAALVCYTRGVLAERRQRAISRRVLSWLAAGVVLDITATALMIASSGKLLTLHGALGYSALAGMLVETALAWRQRRRHGEATVPPWLHRLTVAAYGWWVVAFLSGGMLVALGR